MLIEFYGQECPHCQKIAPLLARLEKEMNVKIERYEVWHNEKNLAKMKEYDTGLCGGVPFLWNTENKKFICGEAPYEDLKKWAAKEGVMPGGHSPAAGILDYNYIADGIYIGTNQCCETHLDKKLKKEKIEADISLEENRVDAPFGVNFYLWLPVKDRAAPAVEQLNLGVAALEGLVKMKKKIYVHCKNGHGRAPTLVAAYFIKQGKTVDEAIALIAAKRPLVHIENEQLKALKIFSKNLLTHKIGAYF